MKTGRGVHPLFLVVAILLVVAAWWWIPALVSVRLSEAGVEGQSGDPFGSVSALFTGLAFAALLYTILLQRQELQLQRQELELTRTVLSEQEAQLEAQSRTLHRQQFESTFFHLVQLVDVPGNLTELLQGFNTKYKREKEIRLSGGGQSSLVVIAQAAWRSVMDSSYAVRQLVLLSLLIFQYVDRSELDDRRFYRRVFIASVPSEVQTLLVYWLLDLWLEMEKSEGDQSALVDIVTEVDVGMARQHVVDERLIDDLQRMAETYRKKTEAES